MSRSWSQLTERGSPAAVRLILWIALHLGRSAARLLLYPISLYFLLTAGPQRQSSREYFRCLLKINPSWWMVLKHIHCFASTILDRVYFLTNRFHYFDIKIHDADILLERVENKEGCILLGSHIGSFEVLRALAVERQLPLKTLMYPEHNQAITEILFDLNPKIKESVIPLGEVFSLIEVHESLSEGGLVGMLGDRVAESDRFIHCQFLGRKARFPVGPVLLAATSGVPVILFVGLYRGKNQYDIHFELLNEKVTMDRDNREKDAQLWCRRYVERLEYYLRLAPYNWFNFYGFWDNE